MSVAVSSIGDTIRAAFPFSIDKFRLSGPDGMRTDHFGLFRSDTYDCIGNACRESYNAHTVDDVVALAEAGAAAFDSDAKVTCTWRQGHIVSIAPSDDYRRSIYGTSDNIFPRLLITAGYDGKAFRGSLGLYRDACRNLAMLQSAGQSITTSIKHTEGLRDRLDDLTSQFRLVAGQWSRIGDIAERLQSTEVRLTDFVREVYPGSGADASTRTRNAENRRIEKIFSRLTRERVHTGRPAIGSDFMVSAWEAFNAVQGYAQHDMNRRGNPGAFDRAIIAFNDSGVRRAEELAMQLAS